MLLELVQNQKLLMPNLSEKFVAFFGGVLADNFVKKQEKTYIVVSSAPERNGIGSNGFFDRLVDCSETDRLTFVTLVQFKIPVEKHRGVEIDFT